MCRLARIACIGVVIATSPVAPAAPGVGSVRAQALRQRSGIARACDPASNESSTLDFSFRAFKQETQKRGLDKFERLRTKGPCAETAPRDVVEFVLTCLQDKDFASAFRFTALPPESGGRGMANAPLAKRLDWFTTRVINGNPTGALKDLAGFEAAITDRMRSVLDSHGATFVGAAHKWGKPNVPTHSDQEYFVEVGDTLLRIYLIYQWLFTCHVIASVQVLRRPPDGFAGPPDGLPDIGGDTAPDL